MYCRVQILVLGLATLTTPLAASADPLTENAPLSTWTALHAAVAAVAVTNAGAPTRYPLASSGAASARVPDGASGASAAATARPPYPLTSYATEPAAWHRLLSDVAQHSRG